MNLVKRSNKKITKIAIYENLPSGGARTLLKSNLDFLSKEKLFKLKKFNVEPNPHKIKNLHNYLLSIPSIILKSKAIANHINNNFDIALVYHSWIIKSPAVLRYLNIPTIYICHEPPREFYDSELKRISTTKEKIVNLLRYPIKIIDHINVRLRSKKPRFAIIANSYFSKQTIDNIYNVESIVIYPGVNTLIPVRTHNGKRTNTILTVGSINKIKNQLFVLEVVSLIPKDIRPNVVLVGNGADPAYLDKLRKFATNHSINLKIFINLSLKKLQNLYLTSKLLVSNPINEPFGLTILEAMSYGLPIVTTENSGVSEIIKNTENILLSTNDHNVWADNVINLLKNKKLYKLISSTNQKIATYYSTYRMNNLLKQHILSLTNK